MGMVYPIPTTGWYGYHWYYQISLLDRSQMIRNLVDPIPTLPTWMKFCFHHVRSNMIRTPIFFSPTPYPRENMSKNGQYYWHPHKWAISSGKPPNSFDVFCWVHSRMIRQSPIFHIFPYFCDIWFHMISHDFMLHRKPQPKKSHWGKPSAAAERTTRSSQGGDVFFQRRDATRRDGGFKDSKKWHPVSMKFISWMCIHTIVYL